MRTKILYHKKEFLNQDDHLSDASIFTTIKRESYEAVREDGSDGETNSYLSTELKIRDCDKAVYLDVSIDTPENKLNTLHKIDVLINHLQQFKQAIHDCRDSR